MCLSGMDWIFERDNPNRKKYGFFRISSELYPYMHLWYMLTNFVEFMPVAMKVEPNHVGVVELYGVSPYFEELAPHSVAPQYQIEVEERVIKGMGGQLEDPMRRMSLFTFRLLTGGGEAIREWEDVQLKAVRITGDAQKSPTPERNLLIF